MGKPMPEDKKRQLVDETKEAALSMLDDLAYLRRLLAADEADPGEVRRMSAILRRCVVENTLTRIANPRIGKIAVSAPDFKPIYVTSRSRPAHVFVGASTRIFGIDVMALAAHEGSTAGFNSFDPDARMDLSVECFGKQEVLFFRGSWVSRKSVIEYVANVASGVHAGKAQSPDDHIVMAARHEIRLSLDNGNQSSSSGFPFRTNRRHLSPIRRLTPHCCCFCPAPTPS